MWQDCFLGLRDRPQRPLYPPQPGGCCSSVDEATATGRPPGLPDSSPCSKHRSLCRRSARRDPRQTIGVATLTGSRPLAATSTPRGGLRALDPSTASLRPPCRQIWVLMLQLARPGLVVVYTRHKRAARGVAARTILGCCWSSSDRSRRLSRQDPWVWKVCPVLHRRSRYARVLDQRDVAAW